MNRILAATRTAPLGGFFTDFTRYDKTLTRLKREHHLRDSASFIIFLTDLVRINRQIFLVSFAFLKSEDATLE